jgi:subtilase-type proteinase RRT12
MGIGPPVQILGARAGAPGRYLADLRDERGAFLTPRLLAPGVPAAPRGANAIRAAIIDTGVLPEHPVIAGSLQGLHDVTGEGPIDENGHGTIVALLLLSLATPDGLVSIKALGRDGYGTRLDLLRALQVALEQEVDIINLSIGSYDPSCVGDCRVCSAVSNVAAAGTTVVAAAGNTPGRTDCPAKAGLFRDRALAVAAWDIETKTIAPYSSPGNIAAPVGRYVLTPVE